MSVIRRPILRCLLLAGAFMCPASVASSSAAPPPQVQMAVFRSGQWLIRAPDGSIVKRSFGQEGDLPIPADYLGRGSAQLAVFRPSTGQWLMGASNGTVVATVDFGQDGDLPAPGDYLGLGWAQLLVFRPSPGQWLIRDPSDPTHRKAVQGFSGENGDLPVLGDYLGLGWEQPMVFRPRTGHWLVGDRSGKIVADVRFGQSGDRPAPAAYPF